MTMDLLPYCAYCGAKMRYYFRQDETFDRRTGKREEGGVWYWECSKFIAAPPYHDCLWHESLCLERTASIHVLPISKVVA